MIFEGEITQIIQRTNDIKSFRLKRPEDFDYKAGQFMMVSLKIDGNDVKKPFSISSSPTQLEHIEFTKKLTCHDFSNQLDSMVAGDIFEINGPYGNMTFGGEYKRIAMLSGGIGITPMISICKYSTDMGLDADIVLMCSNRAEEDIAFQDELGEMQKRNPNLAIIHTLTRACEIWPGCRGRICAEMIEREIPDYMDRVFYICGPPAMVESTESALYALNIQPEQIKKELLVGY
ncbi:MAG: xylene monooxygenase [Methanosarcinales archaeon]|nr:xylene monooxygenase [Methanosarcinales archaeon]